VKFNVGQYGFYRVNYPADDWAKLASLLLHNHLVLSVTGDERNKIAHIVAKIEAF
jgi:hypothetical protein